MSNGRAAAGRSATPAGSNGQASGAKGDGPSDGSAAGTPPPAAPTGRVEIEGEEDVGISGDPVRAYLRRMASVALLTREGEVELCQRIEAADESVVDALAVCPLAVTEVLRAGARLSTGALRWSDVTRGAPGEDELEDSTMRERPSARRARARPPASASTRSSPPRAPRSARRVACCTRARGS